MKIIKIEVGLEGLADIMFDKFIDHSKEQRPPEQKLYLIEGNKIVLPASNIVAFLFNQKGSSCAAVFEGKKRNDYIRIGQSHISITPQSIPFVDENGKSIVFTDFENKFYVVTAAPTTKLSGGGIIKQEAKQRPTIKLPWKLDFSITMVDNNLINETKLHNWFEGGGILIGLGTYRPTYGRFAVYKWEIKK